MRIIELKKRYNERWNLKSNRPLKRVLKQIRYVILYQNKDWQNDSNEL